MTRVGFIADGKDFATNALCSPGRPVRLRTDEEFDERS